MVVWSTARPRSAMSSSKSRKLRQNRRYHRTQVTITCGSNFRFQNNGGRHDFMASRYQIRSCNTSRREAGLRKEPSHDWASHAADAFRTAAVMIREPERKKEQEKRRSVAKLSPWS